MSRLGWWTWALLSAEFVGGLPVVCWWHGKSYWWPPAWIIAITMSLGLLWFLRRTF